MFMYIGWRILVLLGLAASSNALPRQVHGGPTKGGPDAAKAREIKDAYLLSWNAYYEHAFPNDTLAPISNSYVNDRLVRTCHACDGLCSGEWTSD